VYSFHELENPLRGYLNDFPVIIIGVLGDTRFLVVNSEGQFQDPNITDVQADFRFDIEQKKWVDVNLFEPDE
jgi:hypothetical protein